MQNPLWVTKIRAKIIPLGKTHHQGRLMKSKQFGYWTPERQEELWIFFSTRTMSPSAIGEAAKHFRKPRHVIISVLESVEKQKRFIPKVTINENGVRVTVYPPSYADGVAPQVTASIQMKNQGL